MINQNLNKANSNSRIFSRKISKKIFFELLFLEFSFWTGIFFLICLIFFISGSNVQDYFNIKYSLLYILPLIGTIYFFTDSIKKTFKKQEYIRNGIVTKALVKNIITISPQVSDGGNSYDFYLEFNTTDNEVINTIINVGNMFSGKYEKNKFNDVVYLPYRPYDAIFLKSLIKKHRILIS